MGMSGIGVWQLLIVLAIVVMLFGTKRFRSAGADLGSAIKDFRHKLRSEEDETPAETSLRQESVR